MPRSTAEARRPTGLLDGLSNGEIGSGHEEARDTPEMTGAALEPSIAAESTVGTDEVSTPRRTVVGVPVQRRAAMPPSHGVRDPKFKAFTTKLADNVQSAARHQPAKAKVDQAHAAAAPPANDRESQAKAGQVDQMGAAKPGTFDKAAFIAAVHQTIDKAAPKNLDEADNFKASGKAAEVKSAVSGEVGKGAGEASKEVDQATKAPPDPSRETTKPVAPMGTEEPGEPAADPGAADAMPDPKSAADTSLAAGPAKLDDQMAQADVSEEQLAKSNEPSFTGALADKKEAEAHAAAAPVAYRGQEASTLQGAKSEAAGTTSHDLGAMHETKASVLGQLTGTKETAKSGDEAKRAKVAADIEKIYDTTKTEVTHILDQLAKDADKAFSDGEQQARTGFEDEVKVKMDAYKDDRYSGWTGRLKWAKDKLFGMPDAVNVFYEQGKAKVPEADGFGGRDRGGRGRLRSDQGQGPCAPRPQPDQGLRGQAARRSEGGWRPGGEEDLGPVRRPRQPDRRQAEPVGAITG